MHEESTPNPRRGQPMRPVPTLTPERLAIIEARLQPAETGCHEWQGAADGNGYGITRVDGRLYYIHRLIYANRCGPIPEGYVIDHLCQNRLCANPEHLEAVDGATNTLRGNGCFARCARATHCPRGHVYDEENLYVRDGRYRGCRACDKIRKAAGQERRRLGTQGLPKGTAPRQTPPPGKSSGRSNTIGDVFKTLAVAANDCWEATKVSPKGYGVGSLEGRTGALHRLVYEYFHGQIPKGMVLDHLCRNRRCVNPSHLEPVTNQENILRGEGLAAQQVKRTHCPAGHPYDAANTIRRQGKRFCRECNRIWCREYQRQKRAEKKLAAQPPPPPPAQPSLPF